MATTRRRWILLLVIRHIHIMSCAMTSLTGPFILFIRSISVSISSSLNSGVDCTEGEVVITVLIGSGSVPGVRILDSCILTSIWELWVLVALFWQKMIALFFGL